MRLREWYSWHFPELIKIVNDNILYARLSLIIKNRDTIDEPVVLPALVEAIEDEEKAKLILAAAKTSMGYSISELDINSIIHFAERVVHLAEFREDLIDYLHEKMVDIAPNLSALIGDIVGARLINHAGSLTTLAKYPASTIQILGAEKALFRALKTRGNTPKYGLIFNSSFIGRAKTKDKGRISRYLANKAAIAARLDAFSDTPTTRFGDVLKQQVEDRLRFYEDGIVPAKNIDVMKQVIQELGGGGLGDLLEDALDGEESEEEPTKQKEKKKSKKSEKKRKREEAEASGDGEEVVEKKSKKAKSSS